MFEISVTITAPGLEQAINNLAASLQGGAAGAQVHTPQQTAPVQQPQQTAPVQQPQQMPPVQQAQPQQAAPAQQAQAPQQQPPVQQAQQAAATPQAPGVTLEAIINAGAGLVEKGMMAQVVALLRNYGVQAVNQLQPTQYDAFANELRALGAQV